MPDDGGRKEPPKKRGRLRKIFKWIVRGFQVLLVVLAIRLIYPRLGALEHALYVVERMRLWAVVVAVGAQTLSYFGSGYMLARLADLGGSRLSLVRGAVITAGANTVGTLVGGVVGASAATYRWARDFDISEKGATLMAWVPTLLNNSALVAAAVLSAGALLVRGDLAVWQVLAIAAMLLGLAALGIGVAWAARHRDRFLSFVDKAGSWWKRLTHLGYNAEAARRIVDKALAGARSLGGDGGWIRPAAGALANVVFDVLTLALLFVAAGHPVSPFVLVAGYGLPLLIGKIGVLGGAGIVEATMAVLFQSLGVPTDVTVVVVVAYRLLSFWTPTLLGILFSLLLNRGKF